ncbi:flavodoxin family protein [Gordonia sp. ABSL1-1]|uniref:flavodoxin family protein n=1 Tax=Gordonia sp. ABSL1-1 TaxID=3053923 RepID=UPI002572AD10|nr:flavodoxin family protein [Gordonia sp. ABSL1-1]MDL9936880.1 flavodoxin family protein [Gordonia sp. ABSL1-1]
MTCQPKIVIGFTSGAGHTEVLARAVADGAIERGARVALVRVDELADSDWATLDDADAIIFGSPTYMGTASAAFHAFAESTSRRWLEQRWRDKLAAGFTNSACKAGDKHSTLAYFATLAAQHQMNWINLGLHPGWHTTAESEDDLNRLGYFTGATAATCADLPVDAVHHADIATAAFLGGRVAEQAAIFLTGRAALADTHPEVTQEWKEPEHV